MIKGSHLAGIRKAHRISQTQLGLAIKLGSTPAYCQWWMSQVEAMPEIPPALVKLYKKGIKDVMAQRRAAIREVQKGATTNE